MTASPLPPGPKGKRCQRGDSDSGCLIWILVVFLLVTTCDDANRSQVRELEYRVRDLEGKVAGLEARLR